jgi:L-ascorbate metabolism protein UlaG (beta-lactamase superfamily)
VSPGAEASVRQPPGDLLEQIDGARVEPGQIALWYTGGAGYVIRTSSATIYLDPFTGPSESDRWVRLLAPPFDASRVARCDLILSTHEHFDHCDRDALTKLLAVTGAPLAGPASSIERARGFGWPQERLQPLAHGQGLEAKGVRVTAVRAHDPMAEGCNGYVLEAEGLVLVNMGDSLWYDQIGDELSRWRVDAICLSVAENPVGGTYYLSEVDAGRIARDVGARVLIPQHFDLWEWVALDPQRIQTIAPWYAPDTQVRPARYCQRMTLLRAGPGAAVV